MERVKIEMMDPVFPPGESKSPRVPITISVAGIACEVELFLGPSDSVKSATSGKRSFSSTGSEQSVACPITLPVTGGVYHVYVDVTSGGQLLVAGLGTEDVTIITATIGPVVWS